jgi:hypothetical protein
VETQIDEITKRKNDDEETREMAKRIIGHEMRQLHRQLALDLVVMFICFKYSEQLWPHFFGSSREQVEAETVVSEYFTLAAGVKHENLRQTLSINRPQGAEGQKHCREAYLLLLCRGLVQKLQKTVLALSHQRCLPKSVKEHQMADRPFYLSMRVNSIRKKVIKDVNYQLKEYLQQSLTYLIAKLEKFYDNLAR